MSKSYWTVEELANYLDVSRETIRRRIRDNIIKAVPIGRYYRISAVEVKKFCLDCSDE
jgi:excisionase family DNA binding protein